MTNIKKVLEGLLGIKIEEVTEDIVIAGIEQCEFILMQDEGDEDTYKIMRTLEKIVE